jgi:hypothetical protein
MVPRLELKQAAHALWLLRTSFAPLRVIGNRAGITGCALISPEVCGFKAAVVFLRLMGTALNHSMEGGNETGHLRVQWPVDKRGQK